MTQLVHLGVDGGQPLRIEVTLMPETRVIEWDDTQVETVVVQFISYRDRRILEVAYDFFAQADDGSVWYFGETVDNYADGRVSNHSGAWLAGEDGPPGMIMPADPQVGDIYHPENIPGVVFEELIVLATDVSTPGPSGEITGAIRVEEHLMEGTVEQKIFAPGYGEFQADAPSEFVTVAVASPTDARSGSMPGALSDLRAAASAMADAAQDADEEAVASELAAMEAAWELLQPEAPMLLAEQMDASVAELRSAVDGADAGAARQGTIDVLLGVLDLELLYRQPACVDLDRMAVWMRQVTFDVGGDDRDAVASNIAIASVIWARASGSVDETIARRIDDLLADGAQAAEAGDLAAAADAAAQLVEALPHPAEEWCVASPL